MASIRDFRLSWPTAPAGSRPVGLLRRFARALGRALAEHRARRALLALSDAQLRDIGLRRGDIQTPALRRIDWVELQRRRDGRSL